MSSKNYKVDYDNEGDYKYLDATSFEDAAEKYAEHVIFEQDCIHLVAEGEISIQVSDGKQSLDFMVTIEQTLNFSAELVDEEQGATQSDNEFIDFDTKEKKDE